jgi:hypothetical protein
MKRSFAAAIVALALSGPAAALTIEGVTLDDRAKVGPADLVLNGAGLRTRLGFKVYAGGLYLADKTREANAAVAAPGPKRVALHMMRDVGAKQLVESLNEGIAKNASAAEVEKLRPQMTELTTTMEALGEAKKGDVILIDFIPGTGTVITVNGKPRGKPIAGDEFQRALLRVWLGDKPADGDLKKGMLGQ